METALIILISILCVIAFGVLVTYIVVAIAAYKIKKKAEKFMADKGKQLLNDNIDLTVKTLQKKALQKIEKKND